MRKFFIYGIKEIMYAEFLKQTKKDWHTGLLWLRKENKFDDVEIPIYAPQTFDTFTEAKKIIEDRFERSVNKLSKAIDTSIKRKGNQAYFLHYGELSLVKINSIIPPDSAKAQIFCVEEKKFGPTYLMDASKFSSTVNGVREDLLLDLAKQGLLFYEQGLYK